MEIMAGAITALSGEGRITLQVPDICIGMSGESSSVVWEECPDAWFTRLSGDLPSPRGYLHLSRAGWEANKDAMWAAFRRGNRSGRHPDVQTKAQYEARVEEEFLRVGEAIRKKVLSLRKKAAWLEGYRF